MKLDGRVPEHVVRRRGGQQRHEQRPLSRHTVRHQPGERALRRRLDDGRRQGVLLELRPATVDLFAPGQGIRPIPRRRTPRSTAPRWRRRTSPAQPRSWRRIRRCAAPPSPTRSGNGRPPAAVTGLSVTGGRLNAARAVGAATDAPTPARDPRAAQAGRGSAMLTMSTRKADIASYRVYDASTGAYITGATSPTITIGGLGRARAFVVVARTSQSELADVGRRERRRDQPTATTTTQKRAGTATLPATRVSESRWPTSGRCQPSRPADADVPRHPHRTRVTLSARQARRTPLPHHGDNHKSLPGRRCRSPRACSACACPGRVARDGSDFGSPPPRAVSLRRAVRRVGTRAWT